MKAAQHGTIHYVWCGMHDHVVSLGHTGIQLHRILFCIGTDVYEKIRSHEMLERKELLQQQMEEREKQRLRRLQQVS